MKAIFKSFASYDLTRRNNLLFLTEIPNIKVKKQFNVTSKRKSIHLSKKRQDSYI